MIRQLRDGIRLAHGRLASDIPLQDQFRLIHPFTAWFTKSSASSYIALSERDPSLLLFLLHMYTVVVALTLALPATNRPFVASLRVRGMLEIFLA